MGVRLVSVRGTDADGSTADYGALTDVALASRVVSRDPVALETLYQRYGRPCFALARRVLGDTTLAQDAVQEVFLALWRDASRFDSDRGGFSSWLLSMTHHKAVDTVRREENLRRRRADASAEPEIVDISPVDDEVWTVLRRDRVRRALVMLPEPQREALVLAYFGGYTQREIAGLTQTPLGTVKTRMLAGMRRLRGVLEAPLADAASDDDEIEGPGRAR